MHFVITVRSSLSRIASEITVSNSGLKSFNRDFFVATKDHFCQISILIGCTWQYTSGSSWIWFFRLISDGFCYINHKEIWPFWPFSLGFFGSDYWQPHGGLICPWSICFFVLFLHTTGSFHQILLCLDFIGGNRSLGGCESTFILGTFIFSTNET